MKNIYISSRFLTQPITGVQRYGIEISKAIHKINKKYSIKFVAPKNIIHHDLAIYLNVIKAGSLRGQLWDQISLLHYLKAKGNPLVINFSNTLPVFYKNKIVTIHDIIHLKYPVSYSYRKYYEILFPLMLRHSKHIITVSKFSKKELSLQFKIDEKNISVVYNGVDEKFKPKKLNNQEKYILGVSSVTYHKNFVSLLKAFLNLKNDDVKLYIVGGLNTKIFGKDSEKLLKNFKSNPNIIFWGRVDDNKLVELYSNALCFVYPSLYEGFGIPPLEAQACGTPVILSDIPVFREVYGDSALYFNPLNINEITNKIENILEDDNLRELLVYKGFENSKKYTWENAAHNFLKILDSLL